MKRAVVICPGRGTYNKPELGSLMRLNPDKTELFESFDTIRRTNSQETLAELDGAARVRTHNQNMTVAARAIAERKTFGHRSYRVETRRQSLSLPNIRSMRLRRL